MFAIAALTLNAQTILQEDFEIGKPAEGETRVAAGDGWTTVNGYTGTVTKYNWHNYYHDASDGKPTINGSGCAAADSPTYDDGTGQGLGPREEILLTPELNLDDNYMLQFSWKVSPMNTYDNYKYDLQVRIVEGDNIAGAETVFSIQDKNMLKESGVLTFPIDTWDLHISKIDLSDWKGQKVKVAFVYKMYKNVANVAWLDDVSVKKFTPDTTPVPTLSLDRINFGYSEGSGEPQMYVGEKFYSDNITLTNNGLNGLKINSVDLPEGVALTIDPTTVNLDKYESVDFNVSYTASMTSPAKGDIVLHTNGGDATIAFTTKKVLVPEDCTLETFEGNYPPAGWKATGWNESPFPSSLEGDRSVICSGNFSNSYLTTPRLDLSNGGSISFTYYNAFDSEDGTTAPAYDITLQLSTDGGETWSALWVSDYNNVNVKETITIDLGKRNDNCYVRWYYPAIETDDEGAYEHSSFYMDRVLLPALYGADGVPFAAQYVSPANNAESVYPRNITLEWKEAQFADGYKVYVGSDADATDLVNGEITEGLTYTIPSAPYETTLKWKVVPFNSKGEAAGVPVWKFTTQKDASVVEFPYEENFDGCVNDVMVPEGWRSETTITKDYPTWTNRCWQPLNTNKAYGSKGVSMYTMWLYGGYNSTITSPEFNLPAAGQEMSISFVWGDNHPVDLIIDETGTLKKQNVPDGNGYSDLVFEIFADGAWTQAAYLSENYNTDGDTKYWRNEKVDLSAYAGKTVQFRWINNSYSSAHRGAALDNIVIDGIVGDKVFFNKTGWDAGRVNYERAVNSGDIFNMINDGVNSLKVKAVTFGTENFQTSLAAGTTVPVGGSANFNVQFNAKQTAAVVNDVMTIEFEGGYKAEFPVSGEALPLNEYLQSFENNPLDHPWKDEFTMIDVDGQVTNELGYYETIVENDGGRYAFTSVEHNNANLTAHSGKHTVAAAAISTGSANDWLISPRMVATENSKFEFYARNLGTTNSVYVGDNDYHNVGIYVSVTGNEQKDFIELQSPKEMNYLGENQWHHFEVDLSAYAGKKVYIAVRHTEATANDMAFFDDFTFWNFGKVGDINGDGDVNTTDITTLYNVIFGTDTTTSKALCNIDDSEDPEPNTSDVTALYNIIFGTAK